MNKILVFSTNHETRATIESFMNDIFSDVKVFFSEYGSEGVLMAYQHSPQFIITDVYLTDMRSDELTATLKNDIISSNIPIVLLYNKDKDLEIRNKTIKAGADDFLTYPIEKYDLDNSLKLICHIRKAEDIVTNENKLKSLLLDKTNESNKKDVIIESNELFLNTLINTIPSPVFFKNTEYRYIGCNDAFSEYFGITKENLIGKTIHDIAPDYISNFQHKKDIEILKSLKKQVYESQALHADNTIHHAIYNKAVFYNSDKTIGGIVGILIDASSYKKAELQMKIAKQKAEESDKLKSIFLSNMSHEIRTPMNAIMGFAQLLARDFEVDEKKSMIINQILINSELLLKLIDDMMNISQLESGEIKAIKNNCFINQLMHKLYLQNIDNKNKLGKKHLQLILNKQFDNEFWIIQTDETLLVKILSNLLENAIKFTDSGFIKFGYKIKQGDEKLLLEFFIQDTGIGIQKENLTNIFNRFSKIQAEQTKYYNGSGLGLYISKKLIEILGGTISVESEVGYGSTFCFSIPLETSDNKTFIPSKALLNDKINWEDKLFLVVEDEETNYLYIEETLEKTQAKIIWAKNGQKALEAIEKNKQIDLILMDMKMPIVDGFEATAKIKQRYQNIPIIAQTAYAFPNEQAKCLEVGCDDYLVKPTSPDLLITTISKFLNTKEKLLK